MSQIEYVVKGLKVKQKTIFDMAELYKHMYRWFELYGYFVQEVEYQDSEEQNGKHLEIRWYAEKNVNDYVKYVITISFLVLGFEKIEIEREGGKVETNKGEIEIKFDAYLKKDYEDRWQGTFTRFLRGIYDKYIIKNSLKDHIEEINIELYKLVDEVKNFLNMYKLA